jgi:protein-S-isoprenylcysteine O-methyltransferase Ste14
VVPKYAIYVVHAVFWTPFVLRVASDRLAGRRDGEAVAAAPGASVVVGLHAVGIFLLYFAIGAFVFDPASRLPFPGSDVVGAVVLLLGAALCAWTLRVFRSWRLQARLDADHELCTTGPFRWVRHPIYAAMDLLGLGTALWIGGAVAWSGFVVIVVVSDVRSRMEERLLLTTFGEAYGAYRARSRRLIPGIY